MFFVLPVEDGKPAKRFPLANWVLIGLNCYYFYKSMMLPNFEAYVWHHGFIPAHPYPRDILTSMFLHAGLIHLLGNMYFLYVFGEKVEDRLGAFRYVIAYLLSGFGAAWVQYSVNPHSAIPMIGASGAISGICALYMIFFPWQKMRLQFFFLIFPIFSIPARAFFVVGFWFLEQYLLAAGSPVNQGGVAFWAHVGGFFSGMLLSVLLDPGIKQKGGSRA
jgi:membrane associated rhomboid family serine protease